jgi:exopolysaccharide biosynthesis polyprenyl glycosylphosphotransferase
MKHRYSFFFLPFQFLIDWFLLNASFWLAFQIKFADTRSMGEYYTLFLLICNLLWVALIATWRPYNYSRLKFHVFTIALSFLYILGVYAALTAFVWIGLKNWGLSRLHLFYTFLLFGFLGMTWRVAAVVFLKFYRAAGHNIRRYVIVGHGKLATTLKSFYDNHPEFGYRFYGFFGEITSQNSYYMQGDYERLNSFIKQHNIDCVYCCAPYMDNDALHQMIRQSEIDDFQLKLIIDFSSFMNRQSAIEYHDVLPIIDISNRFWEDLKVQVLKRAFDIAFSSTVLLLGSPFLLLLVLITKFSSRGPVFYTQERIGKNGKPFMIYKFRSMYIDAEKFGPALSSGTVDPRITPWGRIMRKLRLDEIPQFYNVLKGDMSVVGPRPERQFFIDQITQLAPEYTKLLTLKPGITSIGQVKFGYAQNVEEMVKRLRYDLIYLNKVSLFIDMWLIWETVVVMVKGKGK